MAPVPALSKPSTVPAAMVTVARGPRRLTAWAASSAPEPSTRNGTCVAAVVSVTSALLTARVMVSTPDTEAASTALPMVAGLPSGSVIVGVSTMFWLGSSAQVL